MVMVIALPSCGKYYQSCPALRSFTAAAPEPQPDVSCTNPTFLVPTRRLLLYREGNEPGQDSTITYSQLLGRVERFANVLKSFGTVQQELQHQFATHDGCCRH
jgi:hypothetical protein